MFWHIWARSGGNIVWNRPIWSAAAAKKSYSICRAAQHGCCHHIHVYHRSYQILLTKTVTQRRWRRRRRRRPSRMKINNCLEKYEIWYKQFLLFYAGRFTLPTLNMFLKLAHGLNVRLKSCKTCLYMLAFQTSFLLFSVFSNNNTIFSANKC